MTDKSIKSIGLKEFKEQPHAMLYTDSNIAILNSISHFTAGKEVKLNCLLICFCEKGEITSNINYRNVL